MKNIDKETIYKEEAMVHFKEIYRVALRLTRRKEEAEELVQETFMQAWKSFEKYKQGTNCRAWLYQILFNTNSSEQRKRFTQSKHFQDVDEFVMENATSHNPVSEHLTDKTVIRAIDKLPEHYSAVIILVDVYDFRYNEVTEILNIPIGTVMSRLNRARKKLRKSLATVAKEAGILKDRQPPSQIEGNPESYKDSQSDSNFHRESNLF